MSNFNRLLIAFLCVCLALFFGLFITLSLSHRQGRRSHPCNNVHLEYDSLSGVIRVVSDDDYRIDRIERRVGNDSACVYRFDQNRPKALDLDSLEGAEPCDSLVQALNYYQCSNSQYAVLLVEEYSEDEAESEELGLYLFLSRNDSSGIISCEFGHPSVTYGSNCR